MHYSHVQKKDIKFFFGFPAPKINKYPLFGLLTRRAGKKCVF